MKFKNSLYNVIFGLSSQIITMCLALIVPRLMILSYGSEINGLFVTVSQLYTYLSLLSAGIGTAAIQVLYRPIISSDYHEISEILSETRSYYRRISKYYLTCVLVLASVLPIVLKTEISSINIILIILLQGVANLIVFYYASTIKQYFLAVGKRYIITTVALFINILLYTTKIVLVNLQVNIVLLQCSYFSITLIQVLIYYYLHKKYFSQINLNVKHQGEKLAQRNFFVVHEISSIIFNSTDIIVLSIFCGLKIASIYAIFNLIFAQLNGLIASVFNGISFNLGHIYQEGIEKYTLIHDMFNTYYTALFFSMMSVCYLLIEPFIRLYTLGADIDYLQFKYLPILFVVIKLLNGLRTVSALLITIAQHAKQTISRTIIESSLNITISIMFVIVLEKYFELGIYGVLIGTIVALLYRTNDIVFYSNIIILRRKPVKTYLTIITNSLLFIISIYLKGVLELNIMTYLDFVQYGIILTLISVTVYMFVNSIVDQTSSKLLLNDIRNKVSKRKSISS